MKKFLVKKLSDLFRPNLIQELEPYDVLEVLNDPIVRKTWLFNVLQEIVRLNQTIDNKLSMGQTLDINDLSHRRRALKFVLDAALEAQREVKRARSHNPEIAVDFDLDNVTAKGL